MGLMTCEVHVSPTFVFHRSSCTEHRDRVHLLISLQTLELELLVHFDLMQQLLQQLACPSCCFRLGIQGCVAMLIGMLKKINMQAMEEINKS